jgi:hypothetical protein
VPPQQPAPVPPQPPKPSSPDEPTARAELQVLLLPPTEVLADAEIQIIGPTRSSERLIRAASGLGHAALAVILVLGTLFLASPARLNPIMTTTLIVAELITVVGMALVHRAPHGR